MSARVSVLAAALLGLAGCGVVYTAPSVHEGAFFGAVRDTDYDVQVVPLTYESAMAANLEPFVPQKLPASFQPGAAAERLSGPVGAGLPALAPIPEPTAPAERRPGFIPDRLPPQATPEPYRIGVADVLLLAVSTPASLEDLPGLIDAASKRQGYVVQDDGAIAIPDVGRVQVAGLTLMDAEAEVFQAVAAAGIDPSFTLEIAEFNSRRVAVGGQVNQPKLVPISLKPLYLNEALQLAGGIGPVDPKVAAIQLFRDGETYQISVDRYLQNARAQNILLKDGDTVFVTTDYREDQAQTRFQELLAMRSSQMETAQFQMNALQLQQQRLEFDRAVLESERALFKDRIELGAVPRQYAYVAGEVREPSRLELPFENQANLADVMFSNRGMDIETADYEEIYVLRGAADPAASGGVTAYHLDGSNAVNLVAATTFLVRPNDVIFVAEQPITSWNRVVSQILPNIFLSAARLVGTP